MGDACSRRPSTATTTKGPRDDADFEYTWESLVGRQAFYERAAEAGRAVIFTAT